MNDVYRHYAPRKKIKNKYTVHPEDDFDDFDGEITGYAVPVPMSSEKGKHSNLGFLEARTNSFKLLKNIVSISILKSCVGIL